MTTEYSKRLPGEDAHDYHARIGVRCQKCPSEVEHVLRLQARADALTTPPRRLRPTTRGKVLLWLVALVLLTLLLSGLVDALAPVPQYPPVAP